MGRFGRNTQRLSVGDDLRGYRVGGCRLCYWHGDRREQRWSHGLRLGTDGLETVPVEASDGEPFCDLALVEAVPHIPHLTSIVLAIMGQHVDNEELAAGLEHPRDFAEDAIRFGEMMENEKEQGDVEARVSDRQLFELAVAAPISLFGLQSGAALATVVGVLVEVPVMLSVVWIVNRSKGWYEAGTSSQPAA